MSRTLFWYVFKDLMKVFFMASGALAGIMSFGGLLRPLTQNGLDGWQVFLLVRYSLPAMSTYSLPVAALFATTVVYGRMSADNELTACRASGISFLSIATPAMLLGLFVSISSLFLLCFTVPNATMKIEQVIVSNLAKLVAHQIEQNHETKFGDFTIFAQQAFLPEQDPSKPNDAAVRLIGPLIVSYYTPADRDKYFLVPKQFYMAKEAIAYIHEDPEDASASLRATFTDGVVFPRRFTGPKSEQGGIGTAEFGPNPIPSQLSQKAKFMNIFQLKWLAANPFRGRDVQTVTAEFIKEDQSTAYRDFLKAQLESPARQINIQTTTDTYTIIRGDAKLTQDEQSLTLTADPDQPLRFTDTSGNQVHLSAQARAIRITADADTPSDQLLVTLDLTDAQVDTGDVPVPRAHLPERFAVPMPADIAAMKVRTAEQYLNSSVRTPMARNRLLFAVIDLINHLYAEMHARAAFVISCLLLVLIGAPLGMMFKSGNFLNAFAVSVVPAMFSIVLIISGQHTAQATPINDILGKNPLNVGIAMMWISNVVTGIAALILLVRLQRQ